MTNEEKANEIINVSDTKQVYDIVDFHSLEVALKEDLMQMAAWKDEQFENEKQSLIDKACEFIAENMKCNGYTLQTKAKFIKEFRKYMKG